MNHWTVIGALYTAACYAAAGLYSLATPNAWNRKTRPLTATVVALAPVTVPAVIMCNTMMGI